MCANRPSLWAVVPVKELWRSKQRLNDVLFADERERLVRTMLHDVLDALMSAGVLVDVLVVTRDATLGEFARARGAEILAEEEGGDLNAALAHAADHLSEMGAPGMLVVPGDVPALTTDEVRELAQAHGPSPAVTLVADRHGQGTNALAASPPDICPFLFGEGSFDKHLAAAAEVGAELQVLDLPGLRHDVDTETDLDDLAYMAPGLETGELLRSLGRVVVPRGLASPEERL